MYLDDCFVVLTKTREELQDFYGLLNNIHSSIKFTMDVQNKELPFLDIHVIVIKDNTQIITDLFYKKTDSHQYLIFNSCNPSHTLRNIPFNLARRVSTNVVDPSRSNRRHRTLKSFLQKQIYTAITSLSLNSVDVKINNKPV